MYHSAVKNFSRITKGSLLGVSVVYGLRKPDFEFAHTSSRTCDFLFKVCSKEYGRMVIHMEFQSSNDKKRT